MKEAQELREATEDYFAQPLDVSGYMWLFQLWLEFLTLDTWWIMIDLNVVSLSAHLAQSSDDPFRLMPSGDN